MALPKQVEQDLKDIEELEKQLTAQDTPVESDQEQSVEETVAETEIQVEAPEPVAVEPSEQPVQQVQDDFEQKYRTLRGKYDAEVPRLHSQVKELMAQMESMKAAMEAKKAEPEPEPVSLITDADREEYGEDLLDFQRRVVREEGRKYESQIAAQEKKIAELERLISQTGNQVGEMTFEQKLHRVVPDFAQVNADPRWINWLDEVDPIIRGPRRTMAQQAFEAGDAEAVADYVKLFKSTLEPVKQDNRKAELEKQVTPTRTNSQAVSPVDSSKKTYSEAQANAVWDKISQLTRNGRYDEASKLEAEISRAYVEGRVEQH